MMKRNGFSIIELMVVVAIICIMALVAIPSYMQYQVGANRTNAESEMTRMAQQLQSYKVVNNNFNGLTVANVNNNSTVIPRQGTPLYDVLLTDQYGVLLTSATADTTGWLLVATPKSGTPQFGTGVICLNDQGQKYWSQTAAVADCTAATNTPAPKLNATSTW